MDIPFSLDIDRLGSAARTCNAFAALFGLAVALLATFGWGLGERKSGKVCNGLAAICGLLVAALAGSGWWLGEMKTDAEKFRDGPRHLEPRTEIVEFLKAKRGELALISVAGLMGEPRDFASEVAMVVSAAAWPSEQPGKCGTMVSSGHAEPRGVVIQHTPPATRQAEALESALRRATLGEVRRIADSQGEAGVIRVQVW